MSGSICDESALCNTARWVHPLGFCATFSDIDDAISAVMNPDGKDSELRCHATCVTGYPMIPEWQRGDMPVVVYEGMSVAIFKRGRGYVLAAPACCPDFRYYPTLPDRCYRRVEAEKVGDSWHDVTASAPEEEAV